VISDFNGLILRNHRSRDWIRGRPLH
jgi:hypothetical protein